VLRRGVYQPVDKMSIFLYSPDSKSTRGQ
jgi:hypothetical protein